MELLRFFNRQQPSLSIPEITEQSGLNRTTIFRFLYTLRQLGLLDYDAETRRYRLGAGVLQVGFEYLNGLPVVDRALPLLRVLRDDLGESTHLGILESGSVVYVARVAADRIVSATVSVGTRLPAANTSMGRVLLAHLSDDRLEALLPTLELRPRTPHSPTTTTALRTLLREVRRQGYAITNQEYEAGVFSIAAPIWDRSQEVIAAINMTGPVSRLSGDMAAARHLPAVLRTANQLSTMLGAVRPPNGATPVRA